MNRRISILGGAAAVALVALTGCGNMKHQDNARALTPSPIFPDGTSARPSPAHTVARGTPAPDDPLVTGRRAGALLEAAPLTLTRELLDRGRNRFEIYCSPCHGDDGYGTGIVVRRGFPAPPSYHDPRLREAAAGHFFDVITHGYGVMPAFGDRIDPRDRWAIVGYIRALQRSQHAALRDVPPAERARLLAR